MYLIHFYFSNCLSSFQIVFPQRYVTSVATPRPGLHEMSLLISPVRPQDAGVYTCHANSEGATHSDTVTLAS